MIIYGQHRSYALAKRHRRTLEKNSKPETVWKITARRNASGQYSVRGHFFTFESTEKEEEFEDEDEFEDIEFQGAFDSPGGKRK